uniref:YTH domain-containing protein n=1 Tax=Schistosoma mansoni TaxID=6183 RepID=A0A3Q0KN77_SCHMA
MASYATEMHASPGCDVSHNNQSQNSSDSYGNKKTSSTHSTNNYKNSFERTNHPQISQSVPSCSDMNPITSQLQQQHPQYRYSDPYGFQRQPESNPRTLPNCDTTNCVPSIYTSPEYNVNSPDLCTQTNHLQSYIHRVSCCLPQCPQCLSYNLFSQSYNFPNNGTALQPPLVLSPTVLNNYSTSALCCPSTSQIPYYFWYNQDPEYQKQYYQTQLAMSKLNLDHASPNTCMMVQSGPDPMHGSLPNQTHQTEANYSADPNAFSSVSLSENPNTIVPPPSLIMPMPRSVTIATSPTTTTMNSSNLSSKINDPSVINQFDYSNASSYASSNSTPLNNQLNGYTTLPMDGVYDPTNSAWYPGYWNSNNLWVSTATGQGGYLTTPFNNNSLSLPISSFSPNPQSFNTDEYAVLHQQYVNTINSDFTGVINTGNNHHHHHSTDLINYNQSRDRTVVVSQQSQQTLLGSNNNNNTASSIPSLSSSSSSIMLTATSLPSTSVSKLLSSSSSSSPNQKEYHTLSYYTNPKSNDSLTNLQNVQYCPYPLPFYNTNNVVNMINSSHNNNHTTASVINHNNTISNNSSSNNNNSSNSNNMRLILTILANSRANTTAIATPNIVHSPYRYSPDRNSLLCNRQKLLSVNPISCNTNTTRYMCKTFPQSELARLNLNVNPVIFDASLVHRARYFIIKSDYVYNVHQSIKYGVWCSTRTGNQCLDEAYQSVHGSTVTLATTTTTTTTTAKSVNSRNDNNNTNIISDQSTLVYNSKLQSDRNEKVTGITSTTAANNYTTTTTANNNKSYSTNNAVQCLNDSSADVTTAPILSVCSTTTTNTNTLNNLDTANVSRTKVSTNDPIIPITTITSTIPTANNGQNSTKSKRTSTSTFNNNINSSPGHIILFFSVRESGYLTGVAEMISPVNPQKRSTIWQDLRFRGEFAVRWLYIKHIPNHVIKHILVECYDNRPVTVLRDTSEILPPSKGEELLRIVHEYGLSTSSSLPTMSYSSSTSSHSIGGVKSSTSKIGNNHNFSINTNLTNSNGLNNHKTTSTSSNLIVPSSTIFNNNNITTATTTNNNSKNIVPSVSICSTIPENHNSQVTTDVSKKTYE